MATNNHDQETFFKIEIGLPDGKDWSASDLAGIKNFIKNESGKRTPEERLNTQLLAIKYRMEAYLEDNEIKANKVYPIEKFLGDYLKVLNLTLKKFAVSIDTTDGNLKKYLSGERKFNTDLAMKFGCFFHTPPDLWINVYTKNELLLFKKEKTHVSRYKKYDYKKVLHFEKA